MSSSVKLAPPCSAEEVAFFAGEEQVTIQARAPLPALQLLDGDIEAVGALHQQQVPLWLAVLLRRRGKCRIIAPEWLDPDRLDETLTAERQHQDSFAPLPYHYVEVAKQLLEVASDDLTAPNRLRATLADIEDTRRAKVERGLRNIDRSVTFIKLTDLSAMELNRIRDVAAGALDTLRNLEPKAGGAAAGAAPGARAGAGAAGAADAEQQKRQRGS